MGAARRTASLVVVARSARALAQAAQRAGFAPYVVDLFGDSDTRASAVRYRRCPMRAGFEFEDAALLAAVADFGRGRPPLVWGGGLEGRPDLLAACARHCEVLGTAPALLPAVIAPETRARRLRELGIATPDVAVGIVPRRGTWVRKRCGEAGGAHVRYAQPEELLPQGHYAQRWIAGDTLSVSFLASRRRVAILGYAAQLFAPTAERPFVWAGAIGGVEPPRAVRDAVAASLPGLVDAFELRGLCGLDFVVDAKQRWWVVEINPRPTATLELLVAPAAALRAHLAACRGRDWDEVPARRRPRALAVPWSENPIRLAKSLDWPRWAADRPAPGTGVPRGAPVCSVRASGATPKAALRGLHCRLRELGELLGCASVTLPDTRQPVNQVQRRPPLASAPRNSR